MKKYLFITILCVFFAQAAFGQAVNPSDSFNLVLLFQRWGGPNWSPEYRWDLTRPVSTWKGVYLDATRSFVSIIDLDGTADAVVTGEDQNVLPGVGAIGRLEDVLPQLDPFDRLETLSLSGNAGLEGSFGELIAPQLRNLGLTNVRVTQLDPALRFPVLERLIAAYCQLSGALPELDKICPNVRRIMFEGNTMSGPFDILTGLPNLNLSLSLRRNRFDALFPPAVAAKTPSLFLTFNAFTFEDLLPAKKAHEAAGFFLPIFEGQDQDSVGAPQSLKAAVGYPFSFNMGIDTAIKSPPCVYTWYKKGQSAIFQQNNEGRLIFNAITPNEAGEYFCDITHPELPELTLYSRAINIAPCQPEVRQWDTLLCLGQSLRLHGQTYNTSRRTGTQIVSGVASNGCDSVYVINLSYREMLTLPAETCADDPIQLQVNNTDNAQGSWTTDKGAFIADPLAAQTTADMLGDGPNVFTWIPAPGICPAASAPSVTIRFNEPPMAKADDYTVTAGESLEDSITANDRLHSSDIVALLAEPKHGELQLKSNGSFTYSPDNDFYGLDTFTYTLCPVNCPDPFAFCDTALVQVLVVLGDSPNIISANLDGTNDVLRIKELANDPLKFVTNRFLVLNAWGNRVFETYNYQNDWSGTNRQGQPLPEATYYYFLWADGLDKPLHGRVAVLR